MNKSHSDYNISTFKKNNPFQKANLLKFQENFSMLFSYSSYYYYYLAFKMNKSVFYKKKIMNY